MLKVKKHWSRRLMVAPHKWRWSHFSWESRKENTYINPPSYHLSLNCRPRCFPMICSFDPLSPRLVKVRNILSRILGVSWRIPMLLISLLVFMSYKFNYWYFFNDPTLKLSNLFLLKKKKTHSTILVSDVANRTVYTCVRTGNIWKTSVISSLFHCKFILKIKSLKIKQQ